MPTGLHVTVGGAAGFLLIFALVTFSLQQPPKGTAVQRFVFLLLGPLISLGVGYGVLLLTQR